MQYFRSQLFLAVACAVLCVAEGGAQEPGLLLTVSGAASTLRGFFYTPAVGGQYWQIASTPRSSIGPLAEVPGNRHLLVLNSYGTGGSTVTFSVFEVDTRVYHDGVLTVPAPVNFAAWSFAVDQEGEVILEGNEGLPLQAAMYRLRGGTFERILSGAGGTLVDLDTGDYIGGNATNLLRIRPWGSVTTIAPVPVGAVGLAQDPETGEFLVWHSTSGPRPSVLLKVSAQGTVTTTTTTGHYPSAMVVDETPTALGEYVFNTGYIACVERGDRMGGPVRTILCLPPYSGENRTWLMDLVLDRVKNVSTATAGVRNRWHHFVDFPSDAGYPYVVLVGVSGIRPGIRLTDARKIRLNPDPITWAVLTGAQPGFSGMTGTLDARGTARGLIDLSSLGPATRGIPFWMVGMVLDPGPPVSIRRVSPPVVVQIR